MILLASITTLIIVFVLWKPIRGLAYHSSRIISIRWKNKKSALSFLFGEETAGEGK
jgi:hypothetical protein